MSNRSVYILALVCSILVYELPSVLTLMKVGWEPIPPVLVADQMLYLNLSTVHHVSSTEVLNPWYGTRVLAVDVPHLMFPVTFVLFRMVHSLFSSWTAAVLAWNALWTALTFAAAAFCFKAFFPNTDKNLTYIAAFGVLVLQSPLIYFQEIWQLLRLHPLYGLPLPYLRFAIPQVILPCILLYWGLQVIALRRASWPVLGGMALLQFAVCAAFPYYVPILALGTGIAFLIAANREEPALTWPVALGFAAVCGVLDIGYVSLVGLGKSHANVHLSLQFRPEMILPSIRPYLIILLVASALVLLSRTSLPVRSTVAGLALASAVFGFVDVFFAPEAQMLQHPHYVIALVTWLPLVVFLWPILENTKRPWSRVAIVCGLLAIGIWEGYSSYRMTLPINSSQQNAIREIRQLDLTERDLVIAPSRFSDDISAWIPLLSTAKVLFAANGENILSGADTRTVQTVRQSLYLMMAGMNVASLERSIGPNSSDSQIRPLLQQTDQTYAGSPLQSDQLKLRNLLRERLVQVFSRFENDPATSSEILGGYDRIYVIDGDRTRFFDEAAFSKWLFIDQSRNEEGIKIWLCHPRFSSLEPAATKNDIH